MVNYTICGSYGPYITTPQQKYRALELVETWEPTPQNIEGVVLEMFLPFCRRRFDKKPVLAINCLSVSCGF